MLDSKERGETIKPDSRVGLSLSFCVRDIMRGNVQEEEVKQVIAATDAKSPAEWKKLIDDYKKIYWGGDPDKGAEIANRLFQAGKIRQPRTEGKKPHNISSGHWIDASQVENWENQQDWK